MSSTVKIRLVVALLFWASAAHAGYERTGPIKAQVCKGFIIEFCSSLQVDAVSEDGKQFFEPTERFDRVDEYNEHMKLCHVAPTRGWWHWLVGFAFNTCGSRKFDPAGFAR
jgi:hypothetical protein